MITWMLEKKVFEETHGDLVDSIKSLGFDLIELDYMPYRSLSDCDFELKNPAIFYGSIQGCNYILSSTKNYPGAFASFDKYKCTNYYPFFSESLLNSPYIMMPYGDLIKQKEFLLDTLGEDGCVFVRPNVGEKVFKGCLIYSQNWENDINLISFCQPFPETLVVVAKPKLIFSEWRFIISNGKIVTASSYLIDKKLEMTQRIKQEVFDFVENVLPSKFSPDPVWALDVCETPDGFKVVEINAGSCAGLYGCDLTKFAEAMSEMAEKEFSDLFGDTGEKE